MTSTPEFYTDEAIPPSSAQEAIEGVFKRLARETSETQTIENVRNMRPAEISLAIQGYSSDSGPLNGFERFIANELELCIRKGLVEGLAEVISAVEHAQFKVINGKFFVGDEILHDQTNLPPQG